MKGRDQLEQQEADLRIILEQILRKQCKGVTGLIRHRTGITVGILRMNLRVPCSINYREFLD
jgi:hypothetical protein